MHHIIDHMNTNVNRLNLDEKLNNKYIDAELLNKDINKK